MRKLLILLALLATTVSVLAKEKKAESGDVAQAITQMEQQWAASAKSGNVDAIAAMLADNFVEMDSDGSMYGKSQVVDRMKTGKWDNNDLSDVKVSVSGNTAIASGAWYGKGTSAGKQIDAHERWLDTWMKMPSGKWECIASASTPAKK